MAYCTIQSALEEAGLWQRELAGTVAGDVDGINKAFVVEHKPLADNNYSDTVTVDDVVAYVDGSVVTVSGIDATSGQITLESAPSGSNVVTVDYSHSPTATAFVADVIAEAEDWLDTELSEVVATPTAATARKLTRIYAAGLLMIRYYALQNNEDGVAAGEAKIKLAESMLATYRERLVANGEDADGEGAVVRSSAEVRLFQRYDESEGTWGPLRDENFRVNEGL